MTPCLILGDSIALGVGQVRLDCETTARVGISSSAYVRSMLASVHKTADAVVISLGVNDDPAAHTLDNLRRMRAELHARAVTWLLPGLKPNVREAIRSVAAENRDRVVDTRAEVGPDHLHPTAAGYRQIAAWTRDGLPGMGGTIPIGLGAPVLPIVVRPAPLPVNPPRWLPMAQVPSVPPTLQQGARFRLWVPTGAAPQAPRTLTLRMASP